MPIRFGVFRMPLITSEDLDVEQADQADFLDIVGDIIDGEVDRVVVLDLAGDVVIICSRAAIARSIAAPALVWTCIS